MLKVEFKNYLKLKGNNVLNLNKYIYKGILKVFLMHYPLFKESSENAFKVY